MKKQKTKLLVIPIACLSIMLRSDAAGVPRQFNQSMLYSESCYSYADNVRLDSSVFTPGQIRLNKGIYGQSAIIFSQDHFNICYWNIDTPIFNSFKCYFTPLCPLAFSIAEWGGNGDLRYSFTPAIATRLLMNKGVSISTINPLEVNSDYYDALGCRFNDKSYKGALQLNKTYLTASANKGYSCGYVPLDYYSWADECQWTFHDKCEQIKNCWNKSYEFKNQYEVVAHTSIAHNSGGLHLVSRDGHIDKNWYPWRSSQAVFDYVEFIATGNNLNIILNDADSYANNLLNEYANGTEKGSLYKSISESRKLIRQMNPNWSNYVKSIWLGNMGWESSLSGDALHNWEKLMYPVQAIWNYRVLEVLYGLN